MDWTLKTVFGSDVSELQRALRSAAGWMRQTGAEADKLDHQLERLGRRRVRIDVGLLGDDKAQADLDALTAEVNRLDGRRVGVDVTVDAAKARAEAKALEADLDQRFEMRAVVDTSDVAAASSEVAALDARADRVEGRVRMDTASIANARRDVELLKKSMKTVAIGGAGTVAAAGGLGFAGFAAVDELDRQQIAFEGLLGSASEANKLLDDIKRSAAETPFELPGLTEAASQMIAMKRPSEDVVDELEGIAGTAAVLGRSEDDVSGVVTALSQMEAKGKASAEEINQLAERFPGFNARAAIAEAKGISTGEAMRQMEQGMIDGGEAVDILIAAMGNYPGAAEAMQRQSQTLSGKLSTFADETRFALADAFEPLKDDAAASIDDLSTLVERRLPDLAGSAGNLLEPLSDVLVDLAEPASIALGELFDGIGSGIDSATPGLHDIGDTLPDIGKTIGDLAEVGIPTFVDAVALVTPVVSPATMTLRAALEILDSLPGPLRSAALGMAMLSKSGGLGKIGGGLGYLTGTGTGTLAGGLTGLAGKFDTLGLRGEAALGKLGGAGKVAGSGLLGVSGKAADISRGLAGIPGVGLIATTVLDGVALAWQDNQEAVENARKAAQEYGDALQDAMADSTKGAGKRAFSDLLSDPGSQLGQITQQQEFQDALTATGQTVDGLAAALAKPGPEGRMMFAELLTAAEDFDAVLETVFSSDDFGDAMDRLDQIGAKNMQDLTNAGGEYQAELEKVIGKQEDALAAQEQWATSIERFDGLGANGRLRERKDELREQGQAYRELTKDGVTYLEVTKTGEVDKQALYQRSTAALAEQGYTMADNGKIVRSLTDDQAALADAQGKSAEQIEALNRKARAAAERQLEMTGIIDAGNAALAGAGRSLQINSGATQAYYDVLLDGQVTQAEANRLMRDYGLTATEAKDALGLVAQAQADTIRSLAEAAPTMGEAVANLTVQVRGADGALEDVQMTADNFDVGKVLDEMHKLTQAAIDQQDNTAQLLAGGFDDLVAQVATLPPEMQGIAIQQLLEMPPGELRRREKQVERDSARLGRSSAQLMNHGYAQALNLHDPVAIQSQMIEVSLAALSAKVATPEARLRDGRAKTQIQAMRQTIRDLDRQSAKPRIDAETEGATRKVSTLDRLVNAMTPHKTITIDVVERRATQAATDLVGNAATAIGQGFAGALGHAKGYAGVFPGTGPDGLYRFAEPETGGELLMPRKGIDKQRAIGLSAVGLDWHGITLDDLARTGIPAFRAGGVAADGWSGFSGTLPGESEVDWSVRVPYLVRVAQDIDRSLQDAWIENFDASKWRKIIYDQTQASGGAGADGVAAGFEAADWEGLGGRVAKKIGDVIDVHFEDGSSTTSEVIATLDERRPGDDQEDEPGLNWRTMGNRTAGPGIQRAFPNGLIGDANQDGLLTQLERDSFKINLHRGAYMHSGGWVGGVKADERPAILQVGEWVMDSASAARPMPSLAPGPAPTPTITAPVQLTVSVSAASPDIAREVATALRSPDVERRINDTVRRHVRG